MKKKINRREIKKFKAIEIKREPFKKLDKKEIKKDELKEEIKKQSEEKAEFHENILEESIDFVAPVIKIEEESNRDEKIDNLEEFASTLPSTTQKIQANPYSNQTNYGPTGSSGGNYDSDKRYDASGKYDNDLSFTQNNVPGSLRTDALNPFKTQTNQDSSTGNRLEESAKITQQYRNEREAAARDSSLFQTRSKREIF